MERIDLHNYEAWFLDYSEGNLSESQIVQLNSFLRTYPELKAELEEFEAITLEEETFGNDTLKASLIREETTGLTDVEYLMVSQIEGTITTEEKERLSTLISTNPKLGNELALFHKTKLPQNEGIIFEGKSSLIQKEKRVIAWWMYTSASAAAILAIVLLNIYTPTEEYDPRGFAWQPVKTEVEKTWNPVELQVLEDVEVLGKVKKMPKWGSNRQFMQQKAVKTIEKEQKAVIELQRPSEIQPGNNVAEQLKKEIPAEKEAPETFLVQQADDNSLAQAAVETDLKNDEKEFVPIQKFAKDKIKKEILKGKTFTETVMDEIADISNEKVTFETNQEKEGIFESFALNIGKLSISRNK